MTGLKPIMEKPIQFPDKTDKTDKTSNGGPEKVGIGSFGSSVKGVGKAPLRSRQRTGNCKMTRTRDNKGRFQTEYQWDKLIPEIIDNFAEGLSITKQCQKEGYPSNRQVSRLIKSNPAFMEQFKAAIWIRWHMFDDDFGEIEERAKEAFYDKSLSVEPIRVLFNILILKRDHLERLAAIYGVNLYGA